MKYRLGTIFLTTFFALTFAIANGCAEPIKEPSFAGTFYPADQRELRETIEGYLARVTKKRMDGALIGLVTPHAGYRYSGQVAAYGYGHVRDRDIRRVIVIGPSHRASFTGASVFSVGSFRTPLGTVEIDEPFAKRLLDSDTNITFYEPAFANEHSIEVQLPFLQMILDNFKIVPILIGSPTQSTLEHLIASLTEMFDDKTLIVASSDLSHYHRYETAVSMDEKIIDAVERLSLRDMAELLRSGRAEMCGALPVMVTMEVAKRRGANVAVLFRYANSGDVTGEKDRVVGYASLGMYRSPYTEEEKKQLLSLARNAITEYVTKGRIVDADTTNPKLRADGAAFVTIKEKGTLRGCIGHVQPVMPLYRSVIENAIAAASKDPRFPPLAKDDLEKIEVEISILSPLQKVKDVSAIELGRHGLVVRKGSHSGLLLPQVPIEQNWDRLTFLRQVCIKAGLYENAWKDSDLYTFTVHSIK